MEGFFMEQPNGNNNLQSDRPEKMLMQVVMSFGYAFNGLFHVMLTQRNMRFHFCMALWVMSFSVILEISNLQKAFLFMIITFVFAMEILNTCVESITNLMSPEFNKWAGIAKDTAAAAVLVVSIGSVMAAGYLLVGPFFHAVLNPDFLVRSHFQLIAVVVIVGSVLAFWFVRAVKLPMALFLIPACASSSFAISHLALKGRDGLAFCAMEFFSLLLFNSLAKRRTPILHPIAGHILGAVIYGIVCCAMR